MTAIHLGSATGHDLMDGLDYIAADRYALEPTGVAVQIVFPEALPAGGAAPRPEVTQHQHSCLQSNLTRPFSEWVLD